MERFLLDAVDGSRGTKSRSEFAREALVEKLASLGVDVSQFRVAPPDRVGKGGRPKKINLQMVAEEGPEYGEEKPTIKVGRRNKDAKIKLKELSDDDEGRIPGSKIRLGKLKKQAKEDDKGA